MVSILLFSLNGLASTIVEQCEKDLLSFPGPSTKSLVHAGCEKVTQIPSCVSSENRPIYQYEKSGHSKNAKRVLVIGLIHGDEKSAGAVGRYWMERLESLSPANSWRIIPVLNPDGYARGTRTNAHKIDLNRNFPTKDWDELAIKAWKTEQKSNPRRNPGLKAGSEIEVQCALQQIEDFKPDFIVSVHTPLKVLDFDGPKVSPPKFEEFPWRSLGNYPGSLGRYMWIERNTPVLTMELDANLPEDYKSFDRLQDVIGKLTSVDITKKMLEAEKKSPTSLEDAGD